MDSRTQLSPHKSIDPATTVGQGPNLTEITVQRLLDAIAASGLGPGDVFATEGELEKRLNVSRPILREAVSRLRALGYLTSKQRTGLIIAKPDPATLFGHSLHTFLLDEVDLSELAEMRHALELGAVEMAVERASAEQIERLGGYAEEYGRTFAEGAHHQRPQDEIEIDFHRTIIEMTHNNLLVRMSEVLSVFFFRLARGDYPDWDGDSHNETVSWEHRAIAEAIGDRSEARARAILTGHLLRSRFPRSAQGRGASTYPSEEGSHGR